MSSSPHFADKAPPIPGPGEVLTLEDVAKADFTGVTPLGVLGYPIKHSVSPQMHNAALAVLAKTDPKFANWRYYRIEVPPERLKEALDLLAAKGFIGLNLTIPHKVLAMQWVKVADSVSAISGAVNTLLRNNGEWLGANTDGGGLANAVSQKPLSVNLYNSDVVLLGAGGAARAIAAICLAKRCKSLWIGNRSVARLDELMAQLREADSGGVMHAFDLSHAAEADLPRNPLVINATSLGLKPDDPSPIDLSLFGPDTRVFDTTYGKHRSSLLLQAEELGIPAVNGTLMLVLQGAGSLGVWAKTQIGLPPSEFWAMFNAAHDALGIPRRVIQQ
jgi:shikimate dehydrogenase